MSEWHPTSKNKTFHTYGLRDEYLHLVIFADDENGKNWESSDEYLSRDEVKKLIDVLEAGAKSMWGPNWRDNT